MITNTQIPSDQSGLTVRTNTFNDVQEQAERKIEKFFCLVELSQVDFGTVLGCSVQLLVAVSVCQPQHLDQEEKKIIKTLNLQVTSPAKRQD